MKIAKFFKAKFSDSCRQYQGDFEKLLTLKQEFDAALENGVKSRNFEDVKRTKTELEIVLRNLELDLKFKVWKTIELGTGLKTAEDFIRALERGGFEVSYPIRFLMEKPEFTTLSEKTIFELVIVSDAELGFPKGATLEEIYKRAQEMGLELCPPEVGPQLRLQYQDQPQGERLRIAIKINDFGENPRIFGVGHDGRGLILGYGLVSDNDSRWVFVRRKLEK